MKFDLPGFKTLVREGIAVEIGFNARINAQLEITAVQETVTVTGESPIVDTRARPNDVRPREAAERSVGARSVGHARAHAGIRTTG